MPIPTGWKAMRKCILEVMRKDLDGGREGDIYLSTLQFFIEKRFGDDLHHYDWDDRGHIGKAFYRALEDLRESGEIMHTDEGYFLPGVHSSRFRDPSVAQGIAYLEEQAGPEIASLAAQFLLHSAAEREDILQRRVEQLEGEVEQWREKAQAADRRLANARKNLLALFDGDEA